MDVWIGLVEVMPLAGSTVLGGAKGAFVNALALASGQETYKENVTAALRDLGLFVIDFQDLELFPERAAHWELREELHELARETELSGNVTFDEFHVYERLDS